MARKPVNIIFVNMSSKTNWSEKKMFSCVIKSVRIDGMTYQGLSFRVAVFSSAAVTKYYVYSRVDRSTLVELCAADH